MKKMGIIVFFVAAIVVIALVLYLLLKPVPELEEAGLSSEEIVAQSIESIDPYDPSSFWAIQDIVELGEEAVEPLIRLADSGDFITQWAVVTGLASVRSVLDEQTVISNQMHEFYKSEYFDIRVYAATSNLEYQDYSGVPILLRALDKDYVLLFLEPPQPAGVFANSVLEWFSGEDFGYAKAFSGDEVNEVVKQAAIASWENWWHNFGAQ